MTKLDDLIAALRTVATLAVEAADELEAFGKTADMPPDLRVGDPSMPELVGWLADALGVSVDDVVGPARHRPLGLTRMCAMAAVRRATGYSLGSIAEAFGRRDHRTVADAVARCEAIPQMAVLTEQLVDVIAQRSGRRWCG